MSTSKEGIQALGERNGGDGASAIGVDGSCKIFKEFQNNSGDAPRRKTRITLSEGDTLQIEKINKNIDPSIIPVEIIEESTQDVIKTLQNGNPLNRCVRDTDGKIVAYMTAEDGDIFLPQGVKNIYTGKLGYLKYLAAEKGAIKDLSEEITKLKKRAKKLGYNYLYLHGWNSLLNRKLRILGFKNIGIDPMMGKPVYILQIDQKNVSQYRTQQSKQLYQEVLQKIESSIDYDPGRKNLLSRYKTNKSYIEQGLEKYYIIATTHNEQIKDSQTISDALRDVWKYREKTGGLSTHKIFSHMQSKGYLSIKKVINFHQELSLVAQKKFQKEFEKHKEEEPQKTYTGENVDIALLTTAYHLKQETAQLGHCIGEDTHRDIHLKKIEKGKMKVFSIRNKNGKSLATVELKRDKDGGYRIEQANGKENHIYRKGDLEYQQVLEGLIELTKVYKITGLGSPVQNFLWDLSCEGNFENFTYLDLSDYTTIPAELGNFTNLISLNLRGYKGKLPKEIGNLTNLTSLYLSRFKGTIPAEIGNLINLTTLDLGEYEGTIPKEIWDLTSLTNLSLRLYEGTIPKEIGNLINLTTLDLGGYEGTIPKEIWDLTSLINLNLQLYEGTIPKEILNLTNLISLNLRGYKGKLPKEIGNLTSLTNLSLGGCKGTIPAEIGNLTNLTALELGYCRGMIPAEIGNLTNLTSLSLRGYKGTIPREIGNLTNLTSLSLRGYKGTIPREIGNLTNLTSLDLGVYEGTIPAEIGNLTNLTSLDLSEYTGTLPLNLQPIYEQGIIIGLDNPVWEDVEHNYKFRF